MNVMHYKDYAARIEYSDEDACFIGHIAGIRDVVGFHGESVAELKAAFEEAVDDYLATCEKLQRAPQRPCSGKVILGIDPGLHEKAAMLADRLVESLAPLTDEDVRDLWAQEALRRLEEIRSGQVASVPGEVGLAQVRSRLGK